MFLGRHAFNKPIGSWNTGKVTNMGYMFYNANAFNQPIGSWNTSAVTDMSVMFYNAYAFNQPIGSWNTNAVTTMSGMFQNAYAFNQPLNTWNPIAVTSMDSMFNYALAFNQPISGNTWNTPVLVSASNMFACANAWLSAHRLMAGGSGSDGPPVSWTASTSGALASPLCTVGTPAPFTSRAQLKTAVDSCLAADATGACDCSQPSVECGPAGSLPISQWDTSQVDDMSAMFLERQRVQSADRELEHEPGDAI